MTFDVTKFQPKLWLDASDSSTRTIDTGVSQLSDKSGNGNHVLQATGSRQPTVSSAEKNGLDMLKFDGTDDYLETTGAFASTDLTVLVVYAKGSSNQRILDTRGVGANGSGLPGWQIKNYNSALGDVISVEDVDTNYIALELGATDYSSSYVIAFIEFNASGGTLTGRTFGGVTAYAPNASAGFVDAANASNPLTIGANYGGYNSQLFSGYFGEAIIFDRVLSNSERNAIEGYLSDKWAIALDTDQPFYNTTPGLVTATTKNSAGAPVSGRTVRGYNSSGGLVYSATTDGNGEAALAYGDGGFITAHGESGKNDLIKSIIADPASFDWSNDGGGGGGEPATGNFNAITLSAI